jgi:hypothetical protein
LRESVSPFLSPSFAFSSISFPLNIVNRKLESELSEEMLDLNN